MNAKTIARLKRAWDKAAFWPGPMLDVDEDLRSLLLRQGVQPPRATKMVEREAALPTGMIFYSLTGTKVELVQSLPFDGLPERWYACRADLSRDWKSAPLKELADRFSRYAKTCCINDDGELVPLKNVPASMAGSGEMTLGRATPVISLALIDKVTERRYQEALDALVEEALESGSLGTLVRAIHAMVGQLNNALH